MRKTTNELAPEVHERTVRLVLSNPGQHGSHRQAVMPIAAKIDCTPQTRKDWLKTAEVDGGKRAGIPSEMPGKLKAPKRENRESRRATRYPRRASHCQPWL